MDEIYSGVPVAAAETAIGMEIETGGINPDVLTAVMAGALALEKQMQDYVDKPVPPQDRRISRR